jgi:acetoin utilization deacetylase AcuC-like enzyme
MMMQRQMSLSHPESATQQQGAADVSPAPPSPALPLPAAPVHKHGTRRSAAAAAAAAEAPSIVGATSRCGFIYDARMAEHVPPEGVLHFEQPGRVRAIFKRLHSEGLIAACRQLPSAEATDEQLLAVHTPAHVARIDFFTSQAAALGDADLYGSPGTPLAARLAAGCVTAAALAVLDGTVQTAFALVRPPGHHAACARCSGFCLFNNVAVAARAVQAARGGGGREGPGRRRIAIVDFDVHHGDGTQAIFEEDPSVLYISLHRFGQGFFPSTGAADSVGSGLGEGFSCNVPWTETGLTGADYMAAFKWVILPILSQFAPDMLFISAGFDAAAGDPLGGMALTPPAYAAMTTAMLAALPPHGRAVIALEGGYNEDAIAAAAEATVRAALRFSGAAATVAAPAALRKARTHCKTVETLRAVRTVQRAFWPCLGDTDAQFDAWAADEEAAHKKGIATGSGGQHHAQHAAEPAPAEERAHEPRTPMREPL